MNIKPTNTFSYLITSSNYPKFIFKNIVKSLFIRIRRICSDFSDYLYFSRLLTFQLQKRGYSNNEICFNDEYVEKDIRSMEISNLVSEVSALEDVRTFAVAKDTKISCGR